MSVSTPLPRTTPAAEPNFVAPSGGRIPVLDGIRGVAVLSVMVFHFWVSGVVPGTALWERVYSGAAGMGWVGVDLFFVLSGFLITGILYDARGNEHYYRVFYARRTVRIFPLYYASLAFFFWVLPLLMVSLHRRELTEVQFTPASKLFAWTYLLNWFEGLKGMNAVVLPLRHFWSLAIEEQFYLVWPFLVLTLGRRRLMALCGGLMALGLGSRIVLYQMHQTYAAYTWTFARADSLAIGALVALCARDRQDWKSLLKWARILAAPALCAVVALRVLNPECTTGPAASPNFGMGTFAITGLGIFFGSCLAMAVCLREGSSMHRVLGSPFLRFFGKYSYCLYICHVPIIVFLVRVGIFSDHLTSRLHSKFLAVIVVNGIAFAASIVTALLSWNLYEKHWLKLKDLPFLRREEPPSKENSGEIKYAAGSLIPSR